MSPPEWWMRQHAITVASRPYRQESSREPGPPPKALKGGKTRKGSGIYLDRWRAKRRRKTHGAVKT